MAYVNPYTKTTWKDEVDEYEDRFEESPNGDGSITHTKVRGTVYQVGTPMDAQHFNNMEEGIYDAHQELVAQDGRVTALESYANPEVGVVTLTNTEEFPFNNSAVSVALTNERDNLNYLVEIVKVEPVGNPGEIEVTDRQVNGFKIGFTGSASSVKVTYSVIGGYDND